MPYKKNLKRLSASIIKPIIGTLLGTEWVLSIANWRQPSQRIAEQFFRIGGEVVQLEKAVVTLVFFNVGEPARQQPPYRRQFVCGAGELAVVERWTFRWNVV